MDSFLSKQLEVLSSPADDLIRLSKVLAEERYKGLWLDLVRRLPRCQDCGEIATFLQPWTGQPHVYFCADCAEDHLDTVCLEWAGHVMSAILQQPGESRKIQQRRKAALNEYTLDQLRVLPTQSVSTVSDLKIDTEMTRVWLSRCSKEDGEPYDNKVTVESWDGNQWVVVRTYKAK